MLPSPHSPKPLKCSLYGFLHRLHRNDLHPRYFRQFVYTGGRDNDRRKPETRGFLYPGLQARDRPHFSRKAQLSANGCLTGKRFFPYTGNEGQGQAEICGRFGEFQAAGHVNKNIQPPCLDPGAL